MTNKNQVAKIEEKTITDTVLNRVNKMQSEGSLQIPENYSPENALKSAYLKLLETKTRDNKPVLQACSQESIANSLLEMVVQGLNPMKNQGYFIAYGKQLTFSRGYLGTVSITKRLPGVKDVKGYPVYKDDEFETEFDLITGSLKVKKYTPNVKSRDPKNLIGAFALIIGDEEILSMEYMDMAQIRKAWNQGATKGNSPAHKNFPDQMAVRTVINRACKMYASTSDDSDLTVNILNRTETEVIEEVKENANKELMEFKEDVVDEEEKGKEIVEVIDEETGEIKEEPVENDMPEMEF